MGKVIPKKDEDRLCYLQTRIPEWLREAAREQADKSGVSLNSWMIEAILAAVRKDRRIPEPPQARVPPPTPADEIRAYLNGETLLTPCGKVGSCDGTDKPLFEHGGMSFCRTCEIRVR